MKTCFGYIRVSTQKQGEGASLPAQKDAITAFANRHNLDVIRWFEEKETAAKGGRKIFNAMVRDLKANKAEGLIIHKIDRSARNLKDWATISDLSDLGIDVYFATESLDFRSRGGRLTADIQAVIAADYIRNLREETIKGLNGRLTQGLYPFRAPIGYRDNGRGQPKTPCPEKGPLVREAFTLYATGSYSLRTLQAELGRQGLKNHREKALSLHGVETILKNPFYTGLIEIKRTGATYDGIHEPLIDARTFARVQEVRAGKAGKKITRHNHLYRGLFRCGLCRAAMTPELQKGHVYYRCQRMGCDTKTIREEHLEAAVLQNLRAMQFSKRQTEKLHTDWVAWINRDERDAMVRSLDMRICDLRDRITRLTDLLIDGTLEKGEYHERKRSLSLNLSELEDQRHQAMEHHLPPEKMEKFLELMKNLAALYTSAKPAEKRSLVENAFSNRVVTLKKVELEPSNLIQVQDSGDLSPMVHQIDTLLELFPKK